MKQKGCFILFRTILILLALIAAGQRLAADDWTVTNSGATFTITRPSSSGSVTVLYRTVSISAMEGKNFTRVSGSLTFADGETFKQVTVSETAFADVPLQYKYQGNYHLYYDFEVTDQQGAQLARTRRKMTSGGNINNEYYLNGYADYVVKESISRFAFFDDGNVWCYLNSGTSASQKKYKDITFSLPSSYKDGTGDYAGYALIDDSWDYTRKPATVSPGFLFAYNRAGATGAWHKLIGNKLYASVYFTEKEKDDGYAYVQILIGDSNTPYDEGYDPNGAVNDPVKSIYKACFELKKGEGAYSGHGKWIFPHSYDFVNNAAQNGGYQSFWMEESYLWQQKFRSESYRAPGEYNNAFVLDPDISALTVRFDCGGEGDDTFGYKDLTVRWALLDAVAPTVLSNEITVSPGLYVKGGNVTVSVPFSEPVTLEYQTRYILHTSWGDLYADYDCSGSNVVSFSGTISNSISPGTELTINSLENVVAPGYSTSTDPVPIKDLLSNSFTGSISKNLGVTLDGLYSIYYNLKGGTVETSNPTKYTNSSDPITLVNPTRQHYTFTGWTGTGLDSPTMTVTIPTGSTGDRYYTATWTPDTGSWDGNGTQDNPYIISTAEGFNFLAFMVSEGNDLNGTYFELGADIDLSSYSPFSGIGSDSKVFKGKFDGKGYSVSNFTINADGQERAGLFRNVGWSAYVKNLVIRNASINGSLYVGAVVGYADLVNVSNCTVTGCTITGTNTTHNYNCVGAAVGYIVNGSVTYCIAEDCTVTGSSSNTLYLGGITGRCGTSYAARSVNNNVVAGCTINGSATSNEYIGTVVGYLQGTNGQGYSSSSDNFILNTTTNGTASVFGTQSNDVVFNRNHHRFLTCGGAEPVSDVFTVTAGSGVNVSGTATVTYKGTAYYAAGTAVSLGPAAGYSSVGGYRVTGADNNVVPFTSGNTFTMPACDVTVSWPVSLVQGVKDGVSAWWGTFYNGSQHYTLPADAAAYTMGKDHHLYRLGTDGSVIPAGTAVVIVSLVPGITFTKSDDETPVTDHAPGGNILYGSDTAVALDGFGLVPVPNSAPAVSGTPYVLGLNSTEVGFRQYTGESIPAGKAYFVVTPAP